MSPDSSCDLRAALGRATDILTDPFPFSPLYSVAATWDEEITQCWSKISERGGPSGASYSVEQERYLDEICTFIGSAFVIGQTRICEAVATVQRLRQEVGRPKWLPQGRRKITARGSKIDAKTGLSQITLIDEVANFYLHKDTWPYDWENESPQASRPTVEVVMALGMSPSPTAGMERALGYCGLRSTRELITVVELWREQLVGILQSLFKRHTSWTPEPEPGRLTPGQVGGALVAREGPSGRA